MVPFCLILGLIDEERKGNYYFKSNLRFSTAVLLWVLKVVAMMHALHTIPMFQTSPFTSGAVLYSRGQLCLFEPSGA